MTDRFKIYEIDFIVTTNGNAPTTGESEDEQNRIYYLNFHINFEPKILQEDDTPQKESGDKVRARVLRMIPAEGRFSECVAYTIFEYVSQ